MAGERYVVLGLAHARSPWFSEVARWATSAALSRRVRQVRVGRGAARPAPLGSRLLGAARRRRLVGLDRDLVDLARETRRAPCSSSTTAGPSSDWSALGVAGVLPAPSSAATSSSTLLAQVASPMIGRGDGAARRARTERRARTGWRGSSGRRHRRAAAPGASTSPWPSPRASATTPATPDLVLLADLASTPTRRCCTTPATSCPAAGARRGPPQRACRADEEIAAPHLRRRRPRLPAPARSAPPPRLDRAPAARLRGRARRACGALTASSSPTSMPTSRARTECGSTRRRGAQPARPHATATRRRRRRRRPPRTKGLHGLVRVMRRPASTSASIPRRIAHGRQPGAPAALGPSRAHRAFAELLAPAPAATAGRRPSSSPEPTPPRRRSSATAIRLPAVAARGTGRRRRPVPSAPVARPVPSQSPWRRIARRLAEQRRALTGYRVALPVHSDWLTS